MPVPRISIAHAPSKNVPRSSSRECVSRRRKDGKVRKRETAADIANGIARRVKRPRALMRFWKWHKRSPRHVSTTNGDRKLYISTKNARETMIARKTKIMASPFREQLFDALPESAVRLVIAHPER